VGSVVKVGTTSVWRTLCPPGVTLGHVLASEARMHTAVLCVGMCAYVLCMCMCVCVCSVPVCACGPMLAYVRLCSISAVFFTFFGNLFGISTNEAQFS